jgi:hypothetical protein
LFGKSGADILLIEQACLKQKIIISSNFPMACLKDNAPSAAEQLRAKAGRTMVAMCGGRGIASFCRSGGMRVRSGAK